MAPGTTTGRGGRSNRGGHQGTIIFKEHPYLEGKEYLDPSSMTPENVPECIDAMMEREGYCREHATIVVKKAYLAFHGPSHQSSSMRCSFCPGGWDTRHPSLDWKWKGLGSGDNWDGDDW